MERADFSKPGVVKNMLWHYDNLMRLALRGDGVACDVCLALKTAIHTKGVLTFKQRRYLGWWWQGFDYVEIATMYHKNPVTVKLTTDLAIKNISKKLSEKYSFDPLSVANSEGESFCD